MGTGYSANGAYPGVPSTGNNQYDYADGRSYPGVGNLASNYQIRRFPNGNFGYQFGDQYAPPSNVPGVPPPVPTSRILAPLANCTNLAMAMECNR